MRHQEHMIAPEGYIAGQIEKSDYVATDERRGRGAVTNRSGRFENYRRESFFDDWERPEPPSVDFKTHVTVEAPKSIITRNTSPDIPFDRSINPYRGCEHGCIYCFARPSHNYMGLSAGLDFERKLFVKPNAAALLRKELSKPNYKIAPIAMGTNTDPYQPIEKEHKITRSILEVLSEFNHPVTILTKSRLIVRDMDILTSMAERNLVKVALSVTTLDPKLARVMEPRASSPQRRLDAIKLMSDAGIPTGAMFAPLIPALNDQEMEQVLEAVRHAGAKDAGYLLLRLPQEVKQLFEEWLEEYFPDRKKHVLNRLSDMRGGKVNDPRFGKRMKGSGYEAEMISRRFAVHTRRLGLNMIKSKLDQSVFDDQQQRSNHQLDKKKPKAAQLSLFA